MNAQLGMAQEDIERIERTLFFEPPEMRQRLIRFTMLILFASIIATGGLLSDSVASVIGAMIVAPLMTPIMGIVVAGSACHRIADRRRYCHARCASREPALALRPPDRVIPRA